MGWQYTGPYTNIMCMTSPCVQVYDGPSAYSCLSLIPNTTLFALVYEKGKISAYESISLARLNIK